MRFEDTLHIARLAEFLPNLLSDALESMTCGGIFHRDPLFCACCAVVLSNRNEDGLGILKKAEAQAQIVPSSDTADRLMRVAQRFMTLEPGLINEPVVRRRNWMSLEIALEAMERDEEIGREILSGIESGRLNALSAHREIERLFKKQQENRGPITLDQAVETELSKERLTEVLIDLLPKAHRGIRRRIGTAISEAGISQAHYPVLRIISENNGVQMRTILDALGLAAPSVYAAIAALERDELIERKPHPSDRRSVIIKATGRGLEKFMDCQLRIATWSRSLPIRMTREMSEVLEALAASGGQDNDMDESPQLALD